jgi:hypothetical protein
MKAKGLENRGGGGAHRKREQVTEDQCERLDHK